MQSDSHTFSKPLLVCISVIRILQRESHIFLHFRKGLKLSSGVKESRQKGGRMEGWPYSLGRLMRAGCLQTCCYFFWKLQIWITIVSQLHIAWSSSTKHAFVLNMHTPLNNVVQKESRSQKERKVYHPHPATTFLLLVFRRAVIKVLVNIWCWSFKCKSISEV